MAKSGPYRRCLETIESFAHKVAQVIWGGEILDHGNHGGDLYNPNSQKFSEVKASGLSNGPIIEESQMLRNCESINHESYIFVCYCNRQEYKGKIRNMPVRIIRSHGVKGLLEFLSQNTTCVFVVPTPILYALYLSEIRLGRIRTYNMKDRTKTYFRLRYPDLTALMEQKFEKFGLNPKHYSSSKENRVITIDGRKITLEIGRVLISEDQKSDSFDVSDFESVSHPA